MNKKNISRKQALKQMGGLALGAPLLSSLTYFTNDSNKNSEKRNKRPPVKNHKQPHIIFIMTDQQRADALGCAGNPNIITPNIDALAKEGTHFTQTYSEAPSCTPARACLLTGQTPWHNGLLGYDARIGRKYEFELPQLVKNGGYYAYQVGKNHWWPQKALHGFDATLVDESGRIGQDGFVSDYRDWFKLEAPDKNPDITGIGWNSRLAATFKLPNKLHPTHWIGQTAVDYLDRYNLDKPLFMKISFERPHSPYDPPQSAYDRYKDIEVSGPAIGDWEGKIYNYPDVNKPIPTKGPVAAAFGDFGVAQVKDSKKHYYANITFVDDQVGKIIKKLKERGMYDNSLICFLSDHGDEMGDHYHWRKTFPYQGSVHIPFIIKPPKSFGLKIGNKIDKVMGLQDILPTFVDATGQEIPEGVDGKSALELMRGNTGGWREYIGMEHSTCYFHNNYWSAVTNGKRKYIWNFATGQEQFFDLENDPHENKDLIEKTSKQKEIAEWHDKLVDYLKERGDGFVKDGKLQKRSKTMLHSPNFPHFDKTEADWVRFWAHQERSSFTGEIPQNVY